MAGRRHHFIPRFLLRGFACRESGDSVFVHVFRKGHRPAEVNTKNVAVERDFYGDETDVVVDEEMTAREGEFASLLRSIRTSGNIPTDSSALVPEFVANLVVRTRHVRFGILDTLGDLVRSLQAPLTNVSVVRRGVEQVIRKDPEKYIDRYLLGAGYPPLASLRSDLQDKVLDHFVDCMWQSIQPGDVEEFAGRYFAEADRQLTYPTVRNSHIEGLKNEGVSPSLTADLYRRLTWKVVVAKPQSLILGDLGPVQYVAETDTYTHFGLTSSRDYCVLVPVSHRHILVGSTSTLKFTLDAERFNMNTAELSTEFFVASAHTRREETYLQGLGTRAQFVDPATMEKIVGDLFPESR